jgi:hypothetical protein
MVLASAGRPSGVGRPGVPTPKMLQQQATQLLGVVLGQPVAGASKDLEPVGASDPSAASPEPQTYSVGTPTRGARRLNGVAARYQASAADGAPGWARARV